MLEENTCIPGTNIKTSLGHLKELGITYINLLPCFDFVSIDEENLEEKNIIVDMILKIIIFHNNLNL